MIVNTELSEAIRSHKVRSPALSSSQLASFEINRHEGVTTTEKGRLSPMPLIQTNLDEEALRDSSVYTTIDKGILGGGDESLLVGGYFLPTHGT